MRETFFDKTPAPTHAYLPVARVDVGVAAKALENKVLTVC
jgi:hypothetical protein